MEQSSHLRWHLCCRRAMQGEKAGDAGRYETQQRAPPEVPERRRPNTLWKNFGAAREAKPHCWNGASTLAKESC